MPLVLYNVLAHLFPLLGNKKCTEIKNEDVEIDVCLSSANQPRLSIASDKLSDTSMKILSQMTSQ